MIEPADDKVVEVKDSDEDTESLFNKSRDSDFHSLFKSMSDFEDDSLDSEFKRSVSTTKAKVREKRVVSTKKRKKLLVKKLVYKVTKRGKG